MLSIKVEASPGEDVRDILEQMAVMASRFGCRVDADINSVHVMVKPGSDPREAYRLWEEELASKRQYKIFCAQAVQIPRDKPWDLPNKSC